MRTLSQPFYIGFEEAHKPRGRIDSNYTTLRDYLQQNGFVCTSFMEFPITRRNLAPYDIIVIPCPDFSKFSKDEIDAIVEWVKEDGGGLLLLSHAGGDKGRRSNLSELAERFGFYFENDQVLDKYNNFGLENLPEIKNFGPPHPITEGITSLCFRAGCSITVTGPNVVPVVISNEESDPFSTPLVVAVEFGEGRVVGCGSYEIFRDRINGGFAHDQHARFALNIFNWLKTEYRSKIKSGEIKPRFSLSPPAGGAPGIPIAPETPIETGRVSGASSAPGEIRITSISEVISILNGLLAEMDGIKRRIKAVLDVLSAENLQIGSTAQYIPSTSEEKSGYGGEFIGEESAATVGSYEYQYGEGGAHVESGVTETEPTAHEENKRKGLLNLEEFHITPPPPKPPSLMKKEEDIKMTPPPPIRSYGEVAGYESSEAEQESTEEDATESKEEEEVVNEEELAQSLEEIKTQIDTLVSKMNSIEELRKIVENKFERGKIDKKQYEQQMKRLDNDKKRAKFKLEELESRLKKMLR